MINAILKPLAVLLAAILVQFVPILEPHADAISGIILAIAGIGLAVRDAAHAKRKENVMALETDMKNAGLIQGKPSGKMTPELVVQIERAIEGPAKKLGNPTRKR